MRMGKMLPCCDIRIMNDNGREVAPGQSGELWIAGAVVVPGYWDDPEANAANFTHGYWHSGDIGSIDDDGFVRIFDRKKDIATSPILKPSIGSRLLGLDRAGSQTALERGSG